MKDSMMATQHSAEKMTTERKSGKKHVTICRLLAPLVWLGVLTGIFPYKRMPVQPHPEDSHSSGNGGHGIARSVWISGGVSPSPSRASTLSPPYRLVVCSPQFVYVVIINAFTILSVSSQQGLSVFSQQATNPMMITSTFMVIIILTIALEAGVFLYGWYVWLCKRRHLENHFLALEQHHRAHPTKGSFTRLILALGMLGCLVTFLQHIGTIKAYAKLDLLTVFTGMLVMSRSSMMAEFSTSLQWVLMAHHTETLQAANSALTQAIQSADLHLLRVSRASLMEARNLCNTTEDIFKNLVAFGVWRAAGYQCYGFAYIYLSLASDISLPSGFLILSGLACLFHFLRFYMTFALAHKCSKTAESTVHILLSQGEGKDQFSREVAAIRQDLRDARVVFTCGDFFDLTISSKYSLYQFLVTFMVMIVQFYQYDIAKDAQPESVPAQQVNITFQ